MSESMLLGLKLSIVGMGIVFLALLLISGLIAAIRVLDRRWQFREENLSKKMGEKEPTIDATTLVIIAAVAATLIAGRGRVRSVRRMPDETGRGTMWSLTGRAILQGSHVLQKRRRP